MTNKTKSANRRAKLWVTAARMGERVFPFLLFLLAFLPRAVYPVARSTVWHFRGKEFIQALAEGEWAGTLLAPHPGVVTMWLAGVANRLGEAFVPGFAGPMARRMAVEVLPLALVISLAIVLAYFLLRRLFGRQVATVSTLLLTIDPFHITISKTVHVDAVMSVFVMLSALWMLLAAGEERPRRWRYVAASGAFAGLAFLSKSPSLFLIPYLLLCTGSWKLVQLLERGAAAHGARWRPWLRAAGDIAATALVWLVILAAVFFLLYPSMWVQPGETLQTTFARVRYHTTNPHPTQVLFMGRQTLEDPGPLYYPVNLALKTTMVTFPLFFVALPFLFDPSLDRRKRYALLMTLAFVVFFTAQMTLARKKSDRYDLPAFQFWVIAAGFGAVQGARWLARGRRWLFNSLLAALVGVQFLVSIPRHPYYGTHYNRLFGTPKSILERGIVPGQEQGEGLDLAAEYLNSLPLAPRLVVGAQIDEFFMQYFEGKTVPMTDEEVDYLVFARNSVVRARREDNWMHLWESYRGRQPKRVISFDGVPYVWVYKTGPVIDPTAIETPLQIELGDSFRLLGYDLSPRETQPGETVRLTLYWETVCETSADYTVFVHLLEPSGALHDQQDSQPQGGMYPTYLWDAGERVRDRYEVSLAPDAPAGAYRLSVGMYELSTGGRLPAVDAQGETLPDGVILLPGPEVRKP